MCAPARTATTASPVVDLLTNQGEQHFGHTCHCLRPPHQQKVNTPITPSILLGDAAAAATLASTCRTEVTERGYVMVPDFVTRQHAEAMAAEASALVHQAYFTEAAHNLFLETPTTGAREAAPATKVEEKRQDGNDGACASVGSGPSGITSVGSIAYDHLDAGGQFSSISMNVVTLSLSLSVGVHVQCWCSGSVLPRVWRNVRKQLHPHMLTCSMCG